MASLVRWEPLREMAGRSSGIDRLLSDIGILDPMTLAESSGTLMPAMDVFTRDQDLVMRAELPGIKPEDVDISVTDDVLTLTAERHDEKEVKEEDYLLRETSWGTVRRSLRLPKGTEAESIQAKYDEGVLEVVIPGAAKPAESQTRKISIEAPGESRDETKKQTEHH